LFELNLLREWLRVELEILKYLPEKEQEGRPILFVHGAHHGAWCWKEHFLPYFSSKGFSALALSLRGHGGSKGYENLHSFSLDDYVEDVLEVMSSIEGKLILVGHSMGGGCCAKNPSLSSGKG
jgi:pimeloyl-ACP methyl ester carboxylesterase